MRLPVLGSSATTESVKRLSPSPRTERSVMAAGFPVGQYTVSSSETWAEPIIAGNRAFVKDKGGSLTLWTIE